MSDYPDPDEEYELMYADELEMLRDEDDHTGITARVSCLCFTGEI